MGAVIQVKGAWAELQGYPATVLEHCLKAPDPDREHRRAFIEGRWDGMVRLYEGNRFPAGLSFRVVDTLRAKGTPCKVVGAGEVTQIDLSRFNRNYFPGIELWDTQMEACLGVLTNPRLAVQSPTGSGKTLSFAACSKYVWEEKGWPSIIVVPKKGLCHQTAERLRELYRGDVTVGECGDGKRTVGAVTVCTAATLIAFREREQVRKLRNGQSVKKVFPADPVLRRLIAACKMLHLDEAHHASAETWYEIAMACNAERRVGWSGTPITGEALRDMRMMAATGPVLVEIEPLRLVEQGLSRRPKIAVLMSDAVSGPPLPRVTRKVRQADGTWVVRQNCRMAYADAYVQGVVNSEWHNRTVVRAVEWMVDHGRKTLVICRRKDHFTSLRKAFDDAGIAYRHAWGDTTIADRDVAKEALSSGRVKVLLASSIFDEGEDVPAIDAVILAEGVAASVNALQRIGRGMRGSGEVWVVDICPTCHPTLIEHAVARCTSYESMGYDVKVVREWPRPESLDRDGYNRLLPFLDWNGGASAEAQMALF